MGYPSLRACVRDLEANGQLVRITREVDPYLEMAAIHRRVYARGGPALLFERVRASPFPAVSNLFGTLERSRFLFRDTLERVRALISLKYDPAALLKDPGRHLPAAIAAYTALPRRSRLGAPILHGRTRLSELPQIVSWPMDGGPFVLLPQVYTEDPDRPGIMTANLGMYRVQLAGNDYERDREVGLHYQIHRGIGIHQTRAIARGEPLKVSIFVGGPPAHTFAAVMPLPEGLSEATFAGMLGGRRFRYFYDDDGHCVSADADFVITGEVHAGELKPEGPFGDHLGYYSLTHPYPVLRVRRVYHRQGAIWPFTVVGRPPQEDTSFGALVHELTGDAIPREVPGLDAVHAVDAAGVHPLCLAIGHERYTPYLEERRPQEILTVANHVLGTNQLSLTKYLWVAARQDDPTLDVEDVEGFLRHMLERVDWTRDLHFQTRTTIDTLDYSGSGLNEGSKLVIAAAGPARRALAREVPRDLPRPFQNATLALPGVLAVEGPAFRSHEEAAGEIEAWCRALEGRDLDGVPLAVLCDDAAFTGASLANLLWVAFTRSNPSHDVHGVGSFVSHKHWGCRGPLVIDARIKPHHAPPLVEVPEVERKVDELGAPGGPLHGII
ncbi:MAG TPA: UbiD family decarboxylase [Vulgatibacter sp.]|nr:UbiD family decarboxylase [Vulgatibacter sp.]